MKTTGVNWNSEQEEQLLTVLSGLSKSDLQNLLEDVMTPSEITEISSRLDAAYRLSKGQTYTVVAENTTLSSRTIARISKWIQNGKGGYSAAFSLIDSSHKHI